MPAATNAAKKARSNGKIPILQERKKIGIGISRLGSVLPVERNITEAIIKKQNITRIIENIPAEIPNLPA